MPGRTNAPEDPTELAPDGTNAVGRMLGLLGDEWTLLILQQALLGAHRYVHFAARLPISDAVLSNRLRMLVGEGLLTPDYRTTARSRSLWPVLLAIWQWELDWVPERRAQLPAMRHDTCGQRFTPVLRCALCLSAVAADDVDLTPGPSGTWLRSTPSALTRRRAGSDGAGGPAGLFPETMGVLGNRWSAAILTACFLGVSRFSDFQSQLGMPPSLVADRLQTFCGIAVLHKESDRYLLTDKGRAFFVVLVTALQWAQRWFQAPEGPAMMLTHLTCRGPFAARWCCDHCDESLRGADVVVEWATYSPGRSGIP